MAEEFQYHLAVSSSNKYAKDREKEQFIEDQKRQKNSDYKQHNKSKMIESTPK